MLRLIFRWEIFYFLHPHFGYGCFFTGSSPCSHSLSGRYGCESLCVERPTNDSQPLPLSRTCLCSDVYSTRTVPRGATSNDEQCLCGKGEIKTNGTCQKGTSGMQNQTVLMLTVTQ